MVKQLVVREPSGETAEMWEGQGVRSPNGESAGGESAVVRTLMQWDSRSHDPEKCNKIPQTTFIEEVYLRFSDKLKIKI